MEDVSVLVGLLALVTVGVFFAWLHFSDGRQCEALTTEGDRCRNNAEAGSRYCWIVAHHDGNPNVRNPRPATGAPPPPAQPLPPTPDE